MVESIKIKRALISVSDKLGLVELAKGLVECGIEIYSTGGTRKHLQENGIKATDIAQYTGFPEVMGGRVKTLHPKIFGGILARRDRADDLEAMDEHGVLSFELVVVNLYPFESTIQKSDVTWEEAVEQIDIGGPSLIRAAAKNHAYATVATSAFQYAEILSQIKSTGHTTPELRRKLAGECFACTAHYDQVIAAYFAKQAGADLFPRVLTLALESKSKLRYGENPHQRAELYSFATHPSASLVHAQQLNGKELSYNNLLDLDSALGMARGFSKPAAVIIKHNNPCGAATSHKLARAARKAFDSDPVSAFGSVIGFNLEVDAETAEVLCEPGMFVEAIVAPGFSEAALKILTTKPKWRENVRLMQVGPLGHMPGELNYRFISGGMLVQEADTQPQTTHDWKGVTEATVAHELFEDVAFAWEMVRHVKSNAIVLAKDAALVGVGAGQMSRVDSVEIAIQKAGDRSRGSVLASDAFFPFPDSIHRAAQAGIVAIIQPGGSRKDDEVIAACNEHRIPMIFTGQRHFKH